MIYGNIYDPNWRNAQLLKELNIDGQGDENEDKTDYTADDDTSSDTANANKYFSILPVRLLLIINEDNAPSVVPINGKIIAKNII